MITMFLSCILTGENFSPSKLEKLIGISFDEKNEKGEIAKIGRFKGKPFPYGSCILRDQQHKEFIIDFLEKHQNDLKKNDVQHIFLTLDVNYKSQCNFELEKDFLSRIANLNIPLSISCYQND